MESASQGIAPLSSFVHIRSAATDLFQQEADPSIKEALAKLGYNQANSRSIVRHIAGTGTLEKAPGINHVALRGHGFDEAAIAHVEDYLPYVTDVRIAFTPWVVGEDFCCAKLKIPM